MDALEACACTVPTEQPEADGTLEWTRPPWALVECAVGKHTGIGGAHVRTLSGH